MYAHLAQVLYLHVNDGIWQTELWYAVFQHTANLMQRLKHIYVITLLHHIASK